MIILLNSSNANVHRQEPNVRLVTRTASNRRSILHSPDGLRNRTALSLAHAISERISGTLTNLIRPPTWYVIDAESAIGRQ